MSDEAATAYLEDLESPARAPTAPPVAHAVPVSSPTPITTASPMPRAHLERLPWQLDLEDDRAGDDATLPGPAARQRTPTPRPVSLDPALAVLRPGTQLGDRWRIERRLGAGGTSVVFAATDLDLGRTVALKVLAVQAAEQVLVERFYRELAIVRQLEHPNIVRMYDEGTEGALHWLSMELLSGFDLKAHLSTPLGLTETLHLLMHACAALGHAHAKGVLHRDVKPANFFLTRNHTLKLTDFGLARDARASALTQAGLIVGTPEYMSPEQVTADRPLTAASDLYALGCVAYQMLTGLTPFRHEQVLPLLMMHLKDEPVPVRARRPRIPAALDALVLRLLAKDPKARPQSAEDVRAELKALWPEVRALEFPKR